MHNAHIMQWNYYPRGDTGCRCPFNSHFCACAQQQPTVLNVKHLSWSSMEIPKPIDRLLLHYLKVSYGWVRNANLLIILFFFPAIQFSLIINKPLFFSGRKEAGYNRHAQINGDGNSAGMPEVLNNQLPFQLKICSAVRCGEKSLF